MSMSQFIPFALPEFGEDEEQEVIATLRSGWVTSGERCQRFESEFRAYTGAGYSLAVNSCTAGLHLALAALDIGPGDEVITTPLTFCATVNTIIHMGATPVLADILPDGNIDPDSVAARITPRTRAIMPVHLAGLPCRMDALWALARQHGLKVIEDAAHAAGSHYRGEHIGGPGSQSDVVAYSFYANKNLSTGEGGMVTTNDRALYERMRVLCLHGINKDAWKRFTAAGNWYYEVLEPGFKYNLSDILAAVGIHQLRKLEAFTARREEYARMYHEALADVDEVELPAGTLEGRHCWHLYMIRLRLDRLSIDRARFIEELRARGIGTSVHYVPVPLHPFFEPWRDRPENQCPFALSEYPRLVSLPLYPRMTPEQVRYVASQVKEVTACARREMAAAIA
jgi:dTDP-4-amino-4,6-dideoxygalactose transaminase